MSAIFGIIDFDGRPVEAAWLKSMQTDLSHRGPDGQGLYQESSMFLGHMLLQVTPESVYDTSPYEEHGFVITADARLDEREAIMDRLNIPEAEREIICDPLLLLRSFLKFGKSFVKDIYGDFAFAIWDKEKRELFCARDQIGIRPFIYYFQDNRFIFSTELKSIVNLKIVNTNVDNIYLRDRALVIYNKLENTAWTNIYQLGRSCKLSLKKDMLLKNRYWFPKYKQNKSYKTEEDSTTELLRILKQIIADHTRTIGDVGADLSGGLDSSTIVCLASRQLLEENKFITTVSSVYEPGYSNAENPDELEYVDEVIKNISNIYPYFVYRSNFNFWKGLIKEYEKCFEPVYSFYYVEDAMFKEYKKKNIRRVLSGRLGDNTVSNSTINPFTILLCSGKIERLIRLIRLVWDKKNESLFQFVKTNILKELTPWNLQKIYFKLRRTGFYDYGDLSHFPYKFDVHEKRRIEKELLKENSYPNLKEKDILYNLLPQNLALFNPDDDCRTSHYDIEQTYPFADRRLIEFLLQIPVEHFYAEGLKRGLIRRSLNGILPHKIVTRKTKGDFAPGHVKIFQNDIFEICEYLTNRIFNFDITTNINFITFVKYLEELKFKSQNDDFTFKTWNLFNLTQIFLFNQFTNRISIMKKSSLKAWSKPKINNVILIKNTLGARSKKGDQGAQGKRSS